MNNPAQSASLICFSAFEVDIRTGELRKNGARVRLPEQPFQVLASLLERPGDLVTREELRMILWADGTIVDYEHSLSTAISKLREVLGDSADQPRYIETLPGRGYRFIAPVSIGLRVIRTKESLQDGAAWPAPGQAVQGEAPGRRAEGGARSFPVDSAHPPAGSRLAWGRLMIPAISSTQRSFRRWPAGAVIAMAAICILAAAIVPWFVTPAPVRALSFTQITHDGREKLPNAPWDALTADGGSVYFAELTSEGPILASVSVEGGDTLPLATPLHDVSLWDSSPDGSELLVGAFGSGSQPEAKELWRQPARGGSPRRLGNIMAESATWSPDGQRIAYASQSDIFLAQSDGTESHKLVSVPGLPLWLQWSPDGKQLRFTLGNRAKGTGSLWEVSAEGADLHAVLPDWNDPPQETGGNWTTDGKYFLFHSARDGRFDIWYFRDAEEWFAKEKREPAQLTSGPINFYSPLQSQNGKKLFVIGSDTRTELLRYDLTSLQLVPYAVRLAARQIAFSKNGGGVLYTGLGDDTLWRVNADGEQGVQLTFPPMAVTAYSWSPDGRHISFGGAWRGERNKIYLMSASGGTPRELLRAAHDVQDHPTWSPDGDSIAFGSVPPSGNSSASAIHIFNLKTGQLSTVPGSQGLSMPCWSPNGRYLAALMRDSHALMLFDFTMGEWTELTRKPVEDPRWSQDGRYIYFITRDAAPVIIRLGIRDRTIRQMLSMKDLEHQYGVEVSWQGLAPDGSPLIARKLSNTEIYALDWQLR